MDDLICIDTIEPPTAGDRYARMEANDRIVARILAEGFSDPTLDDPNEWGCPSGRGRFLFAVVTGTTRRVVHSRHRSRGAAEQARKRLARKVRPCLPAEEPRVITYREGEL